MFVPSLPENKLEAIKNLGWDSTTRAVVVYSAAIVSAPTPAVPTPDPVVTSTPDPETPASVTTHNSAVATSTLAPAVQTHAPEVPTFNYIPQSPSSVVQSPAPVVPTSAPVETGSTNIASAPTNLVPAPDNEVPVSANAPPAPVDFIWSGSRSKEAMSQLYRRPFTLKSHPIHSHILELSSKGDIEAVPDAEITEEISNILKTNRLSVPDVVSVHKSKWLRNKLTKGSKPYLTTECNGREMEALEEPIMFRGIPAVLFAGDSTYKNYRCLAHAARASGLREADRLCNIYNDLHQHLNTMV